MSYSYLFKYIIIGDTGQLRCCTMDARYSNIILQVSGSPAYSSSSQTRDSSRSTI